ncbi:MAG TPA: condensation domain-containing protein, partial [Candidatus Deferrimicrobium sp.]|nr:condensation domain-containing protein [Candidatus Deferrimicrobium sp.]
LYLCAYIVPRTLQPGINPPDLEVTDLREFLAKQLPGYMIPSYFVTLERIPLTANGKIDRSKLPEPLVKIEKIHALPRNKTEKDLADIWQNILGLKKIGIEDNFFDAGGDSIKAIRLISQINERLNCNLKIADLYAHSNIDELAKLVNLNESKSRQALYNKITSEFEFVKAQARGQLNQGKWNPNDIEDIYPMSDIEKGLVFYYMKHLGLGIYHDQFVYSIKYKNFDPGFFKQALTLLVKKHEILRTGFNIEEFAEPMHMVYREPRLNFFQTDLSCLTKDQQQEQIQRLLEEDRHKPFEILNPPLWRMHIYALGNEEFFLIFIFHHAILDGWSMAAFMTELHITYNELKKNSSYVPIELKSSYQDMVIQERIEKEHEWNLQYWKAELQDYTRLEFSEGIKSKDEMAAMKIYSYDGGPEILERSRQAAANWNTHIKNLFFSAFAYMIRMFSYENDIVVGCVTHNRTEKPDGDKVLGCFLNTIPVRLRIPMNITWKEYAAWLEKKMLGVKKYEHLPLFEIALQLGEKNKDRNPFFDTLFNFTDFHIYRQFAGFDAAAEDENDITYNKNDSLANEGHQDTNTLFDFEVDITFKNLFIRPKYNAQVISNNMVRKCCVYFLNILEKYINAPDTIAHRDDILPMAEKEHLLYHFNDTGAYYSREKTMHLLFEEQVLKTKDNTAVIDIDGLGHISYRELNERANRLGNG